MPGQGGGQAFIGYETYIYNAYYRAWVAPDSVTDKLASVDVKIVVARDGSILQAEIVNKSGERDLNRSVEQALNRVHHLPPFPSASSDEQRSFLLRFNLDAKQGSG
jgi:TonB family protein